MSKLIYLDNSATTKPCETAIKNIDTALKNVWGNPSSLHSMGIKAEQIIYSARNKAAEILGCDSNEIFFTSGGTESNNLAVFGAVYALAKRGTRIVTTSVEHPSVLRCFEELESKGFDVVYITPDQNGDITQEKIENAINKETILVSIMLVNNETGNIFPVECAAKKIKDIGSAALVHCDLVQGFGKLNVKISQLNADLVSISAHKIHGPKGIGMLYKSKKAHINPLFFGGGQEKGLRSGTESVPLIAGLLGALCELETKESFQHVSNLNEYLREGLLKFNNVIINSPETALPYILNLSVGGFRSETLLHFLESRNVFVSSSSACSKGKGSHVLREMGLKSDIVDSSLRISFSKHNSFDDIDVLLKSLFDAINCLKKTKR